MPVLRVAIPRARAAGGERRLSSPRIVVAPRAAATAARAGLDSYGLGHRLDRVPVRAAAGRAESDRVEDLPPGLRARMERAYRADFSTVRLHVGEAPRRIRARALTRGERIEVAPDHYRPETVAGQRLLGHELAHVVQQRAGAVRGAGAAAGGVLDHPGLEAEADRQAAQALRGERVSYAGPAGGAAAPFAPPAAGGPPPPAQPAWEYVTGVPQERLNLTDNGDGTFTHRQTGHVFSHQGGQTHHTSGKRLLSPHSVKPVVQPVIAAPQIGTFDPKNVLFGINSDGKVEYLENTQAKRQQFAGKYLEAEPKDFARFKNAGKRSSSSKVQDPVTLKRYFYDEAGKQLHEWDKAKPAGKGKAVSIVQGPNKAPSENEELIDRLTKGELVDRRRKDRSSQDLLPFDVGPYKSGVTLGSVTYPKLTGIPAWTPDGADVNRDHIPSGESLNQRGDPQAYNQGLTIAIPNPEQHQPFSPTFGTDNSPGKGGFEDDFGGSAIKRVLFDSQNPQAAFYRDTRFALESTANQNFSSSHKRLDLTDTGNRLRQIGGYRKLGRLNVKINKKHVGGKRGFDPGSPGIDYTHSARVLKKGKKTTKRQVGKFVYNAVKGKTQGELLSELFRNQLIGTKKVKLI